LQQICKESALKRCRLKRQEARKAMWSFARTCMKELASVALVAGALVFAVAAPGQAHWMIGHGSRPETSGGNTSPMSIGRTAPMGTMIMAGTEVLFSGAESIGGIRTTSPTTRTTTTRRRGTGTTARAMRRTTRMCRAARNRGFRSPLRSTHGRGHGACPWWLRGRARFRFSDAGGVWGDEAGPMLHNEVLNALVPVAIRSSL